MVQREFYRQREDGVRLYRTYSDNNRYLIQQDTGDIYEEAIDVEDTTHTYIEGDEIPSEIPSDEEYADVGRILMGVQDENNG